MTTKDQTKTDLAAHLAAVDQIVAGEQAAAEERGRDVLVAVAAVEAHLAEIRVAVERGNRVPSTISGDSFFAQAADRLRRELADRQAAYDTVRKLGVVRDRIAKGR